MDRDQLQNIKADVLAALADVATQHGVTFEFNGGSFDDIGATLKLVVKTNDVKAIKANAKSEFALYAKMVGADKAWFGKSFDMRGSSYTVVGVSPGRSKNVIKIRRADGKGFVCPVETVAHALRLA